MLGLNILYRLIAFFIFAILAKCGVYWATWHESLFQGPWERRQGEIETSPLRPLSFQLTNGGNSLLSTLATSASSRLLAIIGLGITLKQLFEEKENPLTGALSRKNLDWERCWLHIQVALRAHSQDLHATKKKKYGDAESWPEFPDKYDRLATNCSDKRPEMKTSTNSKFIPQEKQTYDSRQWSSQKPWHNWLMADC